MPGLPTLETGLFNAIQQLNGINLSVYVQCTIIDLFVPICYYLAVYKSKSKITRC